AALPVLFVACWITFFMLPSFVGEWSKRAIGTATALLSLSTPLWSPRLVDVLEYFSAESGIFANVQRNVPSLTGGSGRRVEPQGAREFQPLQRDSALDAAYAGAMEGLLPPRPA